METTGGPSNIRSTDKALGLDVNSSILDEIASLNKINQKTISMVREFLLDSPNQIEYNSKSIGKGLLGDEPEEVLQSFKNPSSLKSLIKKVAHLKSFKNVESIVIYYHLRGQPYAQGMSYYIDSETKKHRCEVSKFSTLFNQIKKSKNKIFSNSNSPSDLLPIIGTYLAQTITTNFYDLIFVASRNDFLPPENKEILKFNSTVELCRPYLSSILERKESVAKFEMIKDALETSAIHFRILKNSREVFRSRDFSLNGEIIKLDVENKEIQIEYQSHPEQNHASEIFHFQRVAILGELLNTLQHELSNPLFGIKLTSELLLLEDRSEEQSEFVQEIHDSTVRCQNIIKDFSTLYKIGEDNEWFNLSKIVKEAITLSKSATQNIYKEFLIDGDVENLELYSNPRWINQIVFNAILNSAQALNTESSNNNKKIIIKIERLLTDIAIIVKDNGPGLGPVNEETLFTAFFTTKKEGTGLGLSICKSLADKLSAEVYLKNNENKGCSFTLLLKNEENTTR